MNTEELKMILEAIQHLGDAGKDAFIVWVALKYTTVLLQALMMLLAVLGVPWLIGKVILKHGTYSRTLQELGKEAGLTYSELWGYYELDVSRIRGQVYNKMRAK